jgi:SAM-dependent methyltransferase
VGGQRAGLPESAQREWRRTYETTPYRELPWFSPRAYPLVRRAVREQWWRRGTRLLDVGCGAGTNSLYLAKAGFRPTGIDLAPAAIAAAQKRAEAARIRAEFRVMDALAMPFPARTFGGAIDIGCYHTLPVRMRRAYARELARVLRPDATFALAWVAREFTGPRGPRHRPSVEETAQAWEPDFLVRCVEYHGEYGSGPPSYVARLERRTRPQPSPR